MYGFVYEVCPVCGGLHDDGGTVFYKGKWHFLCLDCLEDMSKDEIEKKLAGMEKQDKKSL